MFLICKQRVYIYIYIHYIYICITFLGVFVSLVEAYTIVQYQRYFPDKKTNISGTLGSVCTWLGYFFESTLSFLFRTTLQSHRTNSTSQIWHPQEVSSAPPTLFRCNLRNLVLQLHTPVIWNCVSPWSCPSRRLGYVSPAPQAVPKDLVIIYYK